MRVLQCYSLRNRDLCDDHPVCQGVAIGLLLQTVLEFDQTLVKQLTSQIAMQKAQQGVQFCVTLSEGASCGLLSLFEFGGRARLEGDCSSASEAMALDSGASRPSSSDNGEEERKRGTDWVAC